MWLDRKSQRNFQCSSASRKFLKQEVAERYAFAFRSFQCSSASRKFLKRDGARCCGYGGGAFQCSSASRKFLNRLPRRAPVAAQCLSVLFSEPKIPQRLSLLDDGVDVAAFSALQRAENSSTSTVICNFFASPTFQCSSASRKFLNSINHPRPPARASFSALQRAENSSTSRC